MIRVDRGRVNAPAILIGSDSPAALELSRALLHIERMHAERQAKTSSKARARRRNGARTKLKSFTFEVYSRQEIKDALAELFHGKCAYCETPYAATQPVDVEHFRPKAGVDEDMLHPGYYWLAATWENLLPSCIDCNRVRIQQLRSGEGEPGRQIKLGKGNRFPLAAGSPRAQSPEDRLTEQPLLLDPCRDYPESELNFTDDAVVRPAARSTVAQQRAQVSIEVYGLNRTGLVLNRLEVLRLLQGRMYSIRCLIEILDQSREESVRDLVDALLSYELAELDSLRQSHRPYSLMCAQAIDRFIAVLLRENS